MKKINVIIGPTAGGKSKLALRLAKHLNGSVVNADSMQIYKDLSLISARPTQAETDIVPHLLYGFVDAWTNYSVQEWLTAVVPVLEETEHPVLVGGTGLYISSLINGINDIPEIDPDIRQSVRQMPIEEVKKQLPDFQFTDSQRLRRALEVQLSTGKSITYFQNQPKKKLINADWHVIFVNPPRDELYDRCDRRFHQMIEQGGIDEVKHLLSLKATGGVLKAIGVPEIIEFIKGNCTKSEMIERAVLSTKHYAKRQITWFKHQVPVSVDIQNPDEYLLNK